MNRFVKKISVSIMIICLLYEFLVKFHVSHFISYAILIVYILFALGYWKNSWYLFLNVGTYVLAILFSFSFYELSNISGQIFCNNANLLLKLFNQKNKLLFRLDKYQILPILVFVLVAIISLIVSYIVSKYHRKHYDDNKKELFPSKNEAYYKLKKLVDFRNNIYSIGINARYGSGKTFIVNKIKDEIDDASFIDIYSISANIDNIEKYIISELSILLNDSFIYMDKLRLIIDSIGKLKFLNVLEDRKSLTKSFEELKKGIIDCGRKIIFIVDDLDRVYNPEIIYKIFNIFEKIKCKNLKIIYLYDFTSLSSFIPLNSISSGKNMIETKKFITKYISQEITFPDASLEELKMLNNNNNEYIIKVVDEIINIESRISKYNIPTNFFDLTNYSPRDIEIISMQLKSLDIEILNKYNDESIVIETIIFKHFFQDEYKIIMNSKSKLESALYFYNGNSDCFDIRNIISSLKNGSWVIESRTAAKRIKYLVIFLIFNPNINEYNFNNQINPFGRRSQAFNECILEL